ncbi:endonuclease/exonuclease/phosphatase family protein [Marinilabilia rubra]|uniref:Endonuclease n=1 Tax=Marinilabilia rubra TaxID=2162893 RepID=A0A2U2BAY2_9BACT|nr:endonuclease/exonuclease/phosphatase family protein [Marinilabilia rubra]PWE00218.1 endonuclease [Marinilabilia rubra]
MLLKYRVLLFAILFAGAGCDDSNGDDVSGDDFGCVTSFEQNRAFEVVTFNMENFPKEQNTIMHVAELIEHVNADVIAVQEISSESVLNGLANQMSGWEYVFTPDPSSDISLGYLYKATEVELIEEATDVWFEDDWWRFPRAPFVIKIRHRESGLETILINLHLKAMGDADDIGRRYQASQALKEYLDTNHPDDFVIVLGDYNDELAEEKQTEDVFANFTDDSENYKFADMSIATGNKDFWSYPGWPSHIDHILMTDEWFDYFDEAITLRPDQCFDDYENYISDHRPVVAVFNLN